MPNETAVLNLKFTENAAQAAAASPLCIITEKLKSTIMKFEKPNIL
jgi:hypothetical protein